MAVSIEGGVMRGRLPRDQEDDALLAQGYEEGGPKRAAALLPHRSYDWIVHRATRLGISWSTSQRKSLRDMFGSKTLAQIAKSLGRTPLATRRMAERMRLRGGIPDGFTTVGSAAKETGRTRETINRIIDYAKIEKVMRPWAGKASKRRYLLVNRVDLDDAIAHWEASEYINAASERTGIRTARLKSLLIASGHVRPKSRRPWRVRKDAVDAVVAKYLRCESIRAAAERVNVNESTLRVWLRESGIGPLNRREASLEPDLVDRIVNERRRRSTSEAA